MNEDYLEIRLKNAFWMVREMFPNLTPKRSLLLAGAIVQAFEDLKKANYH